MEQLLQKANIDIKAKQEITKIVAYNLGKLTEACVYPHVKKHYYEFLRYSNLTEKDVREYTKRQWAGRKEAAFGNHSDAVANFYIFLLHYYLKNGDYVTARNFMIFYIIRHYDNVLRRQLPYCLPEVFNYVLQTLTKTHLFAREKTIASALYHIADDMMRLWAEGIKEGNKDKISRFIQDSKTRVFQSVRSFVGAYHKAKAAGLGIQGQEPSSDEDIEAGKAKPQVTEKQNAAIENTIRKLTVYKFVDSKAIEEAKNISKISESFSKIISQTICNIKYSQDLKMIYMLFFKEIKNVDELCGEKYYKIVSNLMSIKRAKALAYFKQQVTLLLLRIIRDAKISKSFSSLTSQTKFLISNFLAHYLTLVLRNSLC